MMTGGRIGSEVLVLVTRMTAKNQQRHFTS